MTKFYFMALTLLLCINTPTHAHKLSIPFDQSESTILSNQAKIYSKKEIEQIVQQVLIKKKHAKTALRRRLGYTLIGLYLALETANYLLSKNSEQIASNFGYSSPVSEFFKEKTPLCYKIPLFNSLISKVRFLEDSQRKVLGVWVTVETINCFIGNNGLLTPKLIRYFIIQPLKKIF